MSSFKEGVAICTYNRGAKLGDIISSVQATMPKQAKLVICDDGSTDDTPKIVQKFDNLTYIRGSNKGVGANKNRAIYCLQNCDFICILEDDLMPLQPGWFEIYQHFCLNTNIHHFCRVQDKFVEESVKDFGEWCDKSLGLHPIYGPTPRGDLTFISHRVIHRIGAIHPAFVGVGHAHGQWSDRVVADGTLVQHPNRWIDVKEAADKFVQVGDREGGRWQLTPEQTKEQVKRNSELRKNLGTSKIYIEPFLP